MSAAMDSWEKIEREIDTIAINGDPAGGPGCSLDFLRQWADRLRALRERDKKRWEIVREVEVSAARLGDDQSGCATNQCDDCKEQMRLWADRLREAREGRE